MLRGKARKTCNPQNSDLFNNCSHMCYCCIMFCCYILYSKNLEKKHFTEPPLEEWQGGISYSEAMKSTGGFSPENLIDSRSFGSVYRGVLSSNEKIVANKVLNLQQQGASESFINECNALTSKRHRNLLRNITTCSTLYREGDDFKDLVFEFMSNGNLDNWLHPKGDEQDKFKRSNFIQRLNIAIDIASALDYLHHHCHTPIVHCDLKPSNVLLDEDMTAHVGDFGLARFLFEASKKPFKTEAMSVSLKGSIGYIPPEYGLARQVSVLGDVYSYGILLLEIFTGKRPTDDMFKVDLSLHRFVEMALPRHVMHVIDQTMFVEKDNNENEINEDFIEEIAMTKDDADANTSRMEEWLASALRIGLACSSGHPSKRMAMNCVVNRLNDIRDSFLR